MADVLMPRLADAMEQGTILRWLAEAGSVVEPGQPLVEIETDKATLTHAAEVAGVLEVLAGVGDTLPVGGLIARIGDDAAPAPPPPVPEPPARPPRQTAKGAVTTVELNRGQQAIARRMAESKATVPDFHVSVEVDMSAAVQLRGLATAEPLPTFNDMVVKAAGLALREHPRVNGAYRDGRFELYERVNVGVAVAVPDNLIVPTIFDADSRPLEEIAGLTRELAARARAGTITPPELSGGTFTVTNLGMHGVLSFTAIVSPGQAATLTVGALSEQRRMILTLVCDHRILYGADAAAFLARVRALLESPESLAA